MTPSTYHSILTHTQSNFPRLSDDPHWDFLWNSKYLDFPDLFLRAVSITPSTPEAYEAMRETDRIFLLFVLAAEGKPLV